MYNMSIEGYEQRIVIESRSNGTCCFLKFFLRYKPETLLRYPSWREVGAKTLSISGFSGIPLVYILECWHTYSNPATNLSAQGLQLGTFI